MESPVSRFPTERYDLELFGKQGQSLAKVSETKSGLPLETWTLIVVARKDGRLTIRVNDLPAVEVQVAPGEVGGDKPLIIGSSATGYPWQGKLDEIRKWAHALSEEEQCELFRAPPSTPTPTQERPGFHIRPAVDSCQSARIRGSAAVAVRIRGTRVTNGGIFLKHGARGKHCLPIRPTMPAAHFTNCLKS